MQNDLYYHITINNKTKSSPGQPLIEALNFVENKLCNKVFTLTKKMSGWFPKSTRYLYSLLPSDLAQSYG